MTLGRACLAVAILWAAIFLPGLGSTEIKGEEGRRILPSVAMLESGNWLVPHIAGAPYLRKPPLLNWLIAGSFRATGARTEWTARLPSVLAILALALVTVTATSSWLGVETALVAAIVMLSCIGIIEKGRLAEIEAVYVALTGIGLVCWVSWWVREKSPWLTWTLPFVFLGLAALAKGPLHLFFFYAVAASILGAHGKLRELWSAPHAAGVLLMGTIFAAWAVPYFTEAARFDPGSVWSAQLRERVGGSGFDAQSYFVNFPRALGNFLPWLIFAPLWWPRWQADPDAVPAPRLFLGMRRATVACYGGLLLVPGVLPRYLMPLLVPAALLTAMAFRAAGPVWIKWWQRIAGWWSSRPLSPAQLALSTGALIALAMIVYAIGIIPVISRHHSPKRTFASAIDQAVPPGAELLVFDIGYQPALFYLRSRLRYVADDRLLPDTADCVLVRGGAVPKLGEKWRVVTLRASATTGAESKPGRKDSGWYHVVSLRDRKG